MSIVKMKRLHLIALRKDREALLAELMHVGCVEVSEPTQTLSDPSYAALLQRDTSLLPQAREQQAALKQAIDTLNRLAPQKGGLFTPRELMAVLGEGRLCLAMRLHTLIFSARMAVPVLGLVYDPKVASYLKELDMPSAGDVHHFRREEAIAAADRLMADYEGSLERLRVKSAALSRAARENERLLLELLERKQ